MFLIKHSIAKSKNNDILPGVFERWRGSVFMMQSVHVTKYHNNVCDCSVHRLDSHVDHFLKKVM